MKRLGISACGWLAAALLAGCAGGQVEYSGEVAVASPELVPIEPGVEVVSDANEPMFYSDGYYWLYRDGAWLRSDSYRGGFARIDVNVVPGELRQLPRPQAYAHYRVRERDRSYARRAPLPQRNLRRQAPEYPPRQPQAPRPVEANPMPEQQRRQPRTEEPPQGIERGGSPDRGTSAQVDVNRGANQAENRAQQAENRAQQAENRAQQAENQAQQGANQAGTQVQRGANRAGNQVQRGANQAQDQARRGANQVERGANRAGNQVEQGARDAGNKTEQGARDVGNKTEQGARDVGNKAQQGADKTGQEARRAEHKVKRNLQPDQGQ